MRAAGIDSWIEGAGYRVAAEMLNPRILVAADQLEQALEIASRPIPQAIREQSKMEIPEYEPPVCPKCGAEDPVLESVDPVNSGYAKTAESSGPMRQKIRMSLHSGNDDLPLSSATLRAWRG